MTNRGFAGVLFPKKVAPERSPPTTVEPSMSDAVVALPSVTRLKVDRISAAVSACADPHQTAQRAATDLTPQPNANLLTITLVLSLLGSAERRGAGAKTSMSPPTRPGFLNARYW